MSDFTRAELVLITAAGAAARYALQAQGSRSQMALDRVAAMAEDDERARIIVARTLKRPSQ